MSKNKLYSRINCDLQEATEKNNKFLMTNIKNILTRIDLLEKDFGKELETQDILMILKCIHDELKANLPYSNYANNHEDEVETLIDMLKNYFKTDGCEIEDYNDINEMRFSNGVHYKDAEKVMDITSQISKLENDVGHSLYFWAKLIKIFSIIIGIIIGVVLLYYEYNFFYCLLIVAICWAIGYFSALQVIIFGEIINILHDIRKKIYKDNK